jgi:hypothetical protein
MADGIDIRGGASEFEAAVIAVVLDRITQDEKAAREKRSKSSPILPAWVRAMRDDKPFHPLDTNGPVWIDRT